MASLMPCGMIWGRSNPERNSSDDSSLAQDNLGQFFLIQVLRITILSNAQGTCRR